jgi:hypothetical protein
MARTKLNTVQQSLPVLSKTGAYTVTANDKVILCSSNGGAFSVTLPTAATLANEEVIIKKTDSSANAVTVAGTIDGSVNFSLATQNKYIRVFSDGTAFYNIGSN